MQVVDMCASPGSKTAVILDFMDATSQDLKDAGVSSTVGNDVESSVGRDAPSTSSLLLGGGVLVANDADYKRCCMLVHCLASSLQPITLRLLRPPSIPNKTRKDIPNATMEGYFLSL